MNFVEDEGRSLGSGCRTWIKSPIAAVVKSHGGEQSRKRLGETGQMGIREMNASELLMKCRKTLDGIKTKPFTRGLGEVQTLPVYGLFGVRHRDSMNLIQAFTRNVRTCRFDVKGKVKQWTC